MKLFTTVYAVQFLLNNADVPYLPEGAMVFESREEAEKLAEHHKADGFNAIITELTLVTTV